MYWSAKLNSRRYLWEAVHNQSLLLEEGRRACFGTRRPCTERRRQTHAHIQNFNFPISILGKGGERVRGVAEPLPGDQFRPRGSKVEVPARRRMWYAPSVCGKGRMWYAPARDKLLLGEYLLRAKQPFFLSN